MDWETLGKFTKFFVHSFPLAKATKTTLNEHLSISSGSNCFQRQSKYHNEAVAVLVRWQFWATSNGSVLI